ncbi:hypothetical protein P4689_12095 [Priestia megaterium]|uniref:hypothetical protein n=1 Tax=Priestia megaterium TaxID=1404 RepID=UPI002E251B1E|nr:hypothetical protein [Priestia megaterium]
MRKGTLLGAILLLVVSPIVINLIVKSKPWFGVEAADNNDWIGFYGSYIGGIVTLIALVVTIRYTNQQYKDQDRKRVQPYITIKQLYKNFIVDETKSITYAMGAIYTLSQKKNSEEDVYFKELELHGEAMNIGLGTAVNIEFCDFSFDNKKIDVSPTSYHAIAVGDKILFKLLFFDLVIENNLLNDEYKVKKENKEIPDVYMNFSMLFDDLLGNKYVQQVRVRIQALETSVNIEGEQLPNTLLDKVTTPTLEVSKFKRR